MKPDPPQRQQPPSYGAIESPHGSESWSLPSNSSIGPFTPAQLYKAIPLPTNSQCIRVLDLPGKCTGKQLAGTLRTVDLQYCPKFTALSYVWGDSPDRVTILCNGCEIPVTRSCSEALLSLQEIHGAITIWVDALCIDQTNNHEKSAQIPLMGEIYSWAQAVYIWLGLGSEASDQAINNLRVMSQFRIFPAGVPWRDRDAPLTALPDRAQFSKKVVSLLLKNLQSE